MKRRTNIFLSFLLSIMILWVSFGVITVTCLHSGSVSVLAQSTVLHEVDCCTGNCCDQQKTHQKANDGCMKYQLLKLSPTSSFTAEVHHFSPLQLVLFPQMVNIIQLMVYPSEGKNSPAQWAYVWHSPPRQYLSLLTSLLI